MAGLPPRGANPAQGSLSLWRRDKARATLLGCFEGPLMLDRIAVPWYHKSLDFPALWEEFPPPPDFLDKIHKLSADRINALQEQRFRQQIARGWEVPFYQI